MNIRVHTEIIKLNMKYEIKNINNMKSFIENYHKIHIYVCHIEIIFRIYTMENSFKQFECINNRKKEPPTTIFDYTGRTFR